MDSVSEIKARLPIDELVRQYCTLTKKGRNFVALCPFHHDTRPSFLISPDKGICYCFPCQKGGDIFSFYQQIEGVDFRQALKDLAEKTGVTLPDRPEENIVNKDEKERLRDCLTAAVDFYAKQLASSASTKEYLAKRGVTQEEISTFGLGFAPDSFDATYQYLLKAGFSRKEIQTAGLAIQKDMNDEKIYDRFRNRLMFPIHDNQGRIAGFGGRTLGNDDAKYLNSSDSPLYHKSSVLYGFHHAAKAMRENKRVILVEGYFDVLACHRVGIHEVVATCGTAMTEDHARLLKRSVDRVVLCLDQDKAGRDAAERAFIIAAKEGLQIEGIVLPDKDPADAVLTSPDGLKELLTSGAKPFLDVVLSAISKADLTSPAVRHAALEKLMPLFNAVMSSTERAFMIKTSALALGTTETSLLDDLRTFSSKNAAPKPANTEHPSTVTLFTSLELALGLFLMYPAHITLMEELIAPGDGFALALFTALKKNADAKAPITLDTLDMDDETRHQAGILMLYCEENDFHEWNEAVAIREIRRNCKHANREYIREKQQEITKKLLEARKAANAAEEKELTATYMELLKLSKTAV
ncbi:DNA primase [Candidatus Peribacteria bacterium]|nr:MAG: DNA primase [Candidatus Peribacteria bacterium]